MNLKAESCHWVLSSEASLRLGFSEESLNSWRNCGYLKNGTHWKEELTNANNCIFYNLELCKKELRESWGFG